MASFTDSISQFNPYIAQLPVEAMKQVGMYKQQQYDAGVQKIQAQIDNVAGLDIMKSIDKPYLQSKLDELGSRLKTVAAGDFSNQQLVNSVGGMTGSIIKDPRIQLSVYSTQKAKTELATAHNLYKEGKTSINNVTDIEDKVNNYANSQDPSLGFNERYVNFSDYKKKQFEIADNLKKNAPEKSNDNPYVTNALGQTLYYSTNAKGETVSSTDPNKGVPMKDVVMKKVTIKGISAQTLYDAFKTNLTDDDIAQMKIDAKAHFKGKNGEDILQEYVAGADLARRVLKDGITKLSTELLDPKYTADEKTQMQTLMNQYSDKLTNGSFEQEYNKLQESLKDPKNLDKAYFDAYSRNMLNKQATDLSNQSYKEELLSNPYEAADMARKTLQQTIIRDNQNHQEAIAANKLGYDKLTHDKWKDKMDLYWKEKTFNAEHPGIIVEDKAISTAIEAPSVETVIKAISTANENKTKLDNEYGKFLGKDKAGLDALYDKWVKDHGSITGKDAKKYVERRNQFENEVVRQNNIKKLVDEGSKAFDEKIDETLNKEVGLLGKDGKELLSAKDLYEVRTIVVGNTHTLHTGGGHYESNIDVPAILKAVGSNKQKLAIANALIKNYNQDPTTTSTEKTIASKSLGLLNKMAPEIGKVVEEKYKYQAETIANLDPYYQQQIGTIPKENKTYNDALDQLVGNTITKLNSGQGLDMPSGIPLPTKDGLAKLRAKGADGKLLATSTFIKSRDGSALIELNQGSTTEVIPISAANLAKYFPDVAKTNPMNQDFYDVAASPHRTTNKSAGVGNTSADYVTAAHSGYEASLLRGTPWANKVRWDVIGDPDNEIAGKVAEKKYALRLFVQGADGKWRVDETQGDYKDPATIQDYIQNQMGTNTIEMFLKTHK